MIVRRRLVASFADPTPLLWLITDPCDVTVILRSPCPAIQSRGSPTVPCWFPHLAVRQSLISCHGSRSLHAVPLSDSSVSRRGPRDRGRLQSSCARERAGSGQGRLEV